jgi:hypothetical protein
MLPFSGCEAAIQAKSQLPITTKLPLSSASIVIGELYARTKAQTVHTCEEIILYSPG